MTGDKTMMPRPCRPIGLGRRQAGSRIVTALAAPSFTFGPSGFTCLVHKHMPLNLGSAKSFLNTSTVMSRNAGAAVTTVTFVLNEDLISGGGNTFGRSNSNPSPRDKHGPRTTPRLLSALHLPKIGYAPLRGLAVHR